MGTRGEPRLWLIGLSMPLTLGAIMVLSLLSAPESPRGEDPYVIRYAIGLLGGLFLFVYGGVFTLALLLWRRSKRPVPEQNELIESIPESGEGEDDLPVY